MPTFNEFYENGYYTVDKELRLYILNLGMICTYQLLSQFKLNSPCYSDYSAFNYNEGETQ